MKQSIHLLAICLWLFVCNFSLQGQDHPITFEPVNLQDGAGFEGGYCVMQDRKGYVWFGTTNGLHRYNGYSSKVYKYDPKDTTSLANNFIITIWEDRNGIIWIGTNGGGLCRFDPATETFVRYYQQAHLSGLKYQGITTINEDEEGMLWLGTFEGVFRFNPKDGKFFRIRHEPTDPASISNHSLVTKIFKDHQGIIWIGSSAHGLDRVNIKKAEGGKPATITFSHYLHEPSNPTSLSNNSVWAICQDKSGLLWIGTKEGLNRLNQHTDTFTRFQHDPANPHSISNHKFLHNGLAEDQQGNLWIGTVDGLIKFNRQRTRFTTYYRTTPDGRKAFNNNFMSLLIDKAGTLWAATEGFQKVDLNQRQITLLQHQPGNTNSLPHNDVWAVMEDKQGYVWIGTDGGLSRLEPKTGSFIHYLPAAASPNGIGGGFINALLEDSKGNIWIGGGGQRGAVSIPGLYQFDPKSGKFTRFLKELPPLAINTIYEDHQGIIWIGTYGDGMRSFDPKANLWQNYAPDSNNPNAMVGKWAHALCEDGQGNLWFGTDEGLSKLDLQRTTFSNYRYDPQNPRSLSYNRIISLCTDSKGNLWIGTDGGGFCRYNPQTDDFDRYTEKEGLLDNSIGSILEDAEGNLWLGTNKGLCRFAPDTKKFTYVDIGDGFPENQAIEIQVNKRASFKGKDGTLYFGGSNGLKIFHPRQLGSNTYVPPVVITQFKLFDKVLPGKHEAKEIMLGYNENFISFEFAALNYTNSHKNQYAYQLIGVDKEWVYSNNRRYANYTDLDAGSYTFRVKGSNNDGIWNEQGAALTLIIKPPPWQTSWAYVGYGLFTLILLFIARQSIVKRERLKANFRIKEIESAKLRELDALKSRLFTNISHEFRTPLSLIKGVSRKLQKLDTSLERKPDYQLLDRNADRLLELINQLLDLSKLEAGKLSLHPLPGEITGFLKSIAGSIASLFESKGITYRYTIPLQHYWVEMDQEKVGVILTNLLSNAYKFTPQGGQVGLSARLEAITDTHCALQLLVEDTGMGIPAGELPYIFDRFHQVDGSATRSYEGTGIGLSLVKELVDLHGGKLSVESTEGKGTTFYITLTFPFVSPQQAAKAPQETHPDQAPAIHEPIAQVATHVEVEKNGFPQHSNQRKEYQVLVVEDNTDLRHFLKESLSPYYQVMQAVDGQEGLSKALETIPDLVISDVMMPGMDGISLCDKLKKDERTSHVPLILLTAKANMSSKLLGLEIGADEYLAKPFELEELLVRVKNLLDGRKKLREKFSKQITVNPKEITVTSTDEKFLQKALSIVEANIGNADFDVEAFGKEIGMSRSQLHRKLTALTDQTPTDFIRLLRLKRAAHLLEQRHGNVSEVALAVGFNSLNYFTRCFREEYGKTPTEYTNGASGIQA